MNFQEFCRSLEKTDHQKVYTNNTFVINYNNSKGESFSIDPYDILRFLEFLSSNYERIEAAWNTIGSKKDSLTKYEEKSYREIYKAVGQEDELKTISTSGRSQTKALTKVITKMICYLGKTPYITVEENTYFDNVSIDKALSNLPENLIELGGSDSSSNVKNNVKSLFKKWMKEEKKLSNRTIYSYADSGINVVDKFIKKINPSFESIYKLTAAADIVSIKEQLSILPEWKQKNTTGNNMYIAALSKFQEFLDTVENNILVSIDNLTLPKPFLLLAGISGTGKTRFVSEQASAYGPNANNHCLVSVRPDWHEPSDLLGYVSRLSGKAEYVSTQVLDFIIKAWKVAAPEANASGTGKLNPSAVPYWLCLDEMNLAPVEQYFADYLSVLESRKFRDGKYYCEPLLDKTLLLALSSNDGKIKSDFGLDDDDSLWEYFLNHGIPIPPNLIVAGTVNMDETTHGFSRKVIDRAITFDFGEFFPNDYDSFFQPETSPKTFTYSLLTQAKQSDLSGTYDPDGDKTVNFLKNVNEILKQTPFELAYRALNELLLQVACFKPDSEHQLQAVWDDFLMSKVLPRIDGDEDKLRYKNADNTITNLLEPLSDILSKQLNTIWDETRQDFHRQKIDGSEVDGISCRSKAKLAWMKNRLDTNTFTSFWP